MTTDTERLQAVADEMERRLAARLEASRNRPMSARLVTAGIWATVIPGITLVTLTIMSMAGPSVDNLRQDLNAILATSAIVGAIVFIGGQALDASQRSYRQLGEDLKALDFAALGRLAAQLQEIEIALPSLRAHGEADRSMLLVEIRKAESQRQADVTAIRENGAKMFGELADQLDGLRQDLGLLARVTVQLAESMQRMADAGSARSVEGVDPVDPKYLADMSEAVRLGREIERRRRDGE